jgi:hypothetical protein
MKRAAGGIGYIVADTGLPDVGRNSTGQFVEPGAVYTIALKPKRWRFGRRSGGERIAAFAMKHIQPFRSRLLDAVPIHYLLATRAERLGKQ